MAGDTSQSAAAHQKTAAGLQTDRGEANGSGVVKFRCGRSVALIGSAMASGAQSDRPVAPDGRGRGRVRITGAVAGFAVHAWASAGHVATETSPFILLGLHNAQRSSDGVGRLAGVAGSQAEPVACGVAADPVFYPLAVNSQQRSCGKVPGAEEPLNSRFARLTVAGDGDAAG